MLIVDNGSVSQLLTMNDCICAQQEAWMLRMARNLTDAETAILRGTRHADTARCTSTWRIAIASATTKASAISGMLNYHERAAA